jgi:hypothetical protein
MALSNIDFIEQLAKKYGGPNLGGLANPSSPNLPALGVPRSRDGVSSPVLDQGLPAITPAVAATVQPPANLPPIAPPPIDSSMMGSADSQDATGPQLPPIGPTAAPSTSPMDSLDPTGDNRIQAASNLPAVTTPTATATPAASLPAVGGPSNAEQELSDLDHKRYNAGVYKLSDGSTTKDPKKYAADAATPGSTAQVITAPGKDRSKKWSTMQKIGSFLEGWAYGGLPGGIKAGTDRNFFQKQADENQRERLLPIVGDERARAKYEQDRQLEQAKIDDIPADNEIKKQQMEEQAATAKERQAGIALSRLTKLKYYNPKDAAHVKLAKAAGLDPQDLQGWDDRNPVEKTVAGVSYRLNRDTGDYEPTNLPKDESKTVTTYDVVMPNGERRSFAVTQKDAAGFANQMSKLGVQIAARKELAKTNIAARSDLQSERLAAQQQQILQKVKSGDETEQKRLKASFLKAHPKATPEQLNQFLTQVMQ